MKISVVIQTYNEETNLPLALESVKDFDEIVVCDMYSTDNTVRIAEEYGCKVVFYENMGFPEPARTFAIQSASNDWVLIVDADEIVPAKLKEYLYNRITSGNCPAGIRIPRKNYFMGKYMHAAYPDYVLRFLKKEGTVWPPYIHSQPSVRGEIVKIPAKRKELAFIHMADESVKTRMNKSNRYSEKELEKKIGKKYSVLVLLVGCSFRFIKYYLFKGGFRDGKAGLVNAIYSSYVKFIIISKVWEQQVQYTDRQQDLGKSILK